MSRKEEILGKDDNGHRRRLATLELHIGSEYYRTGEFHNNISNAMDEYAKEIAIGFGRFLQENYYLDNVGFYHHDYQNKIYFNIEELFNQYIQSLTK